jgi:hypothetical protein
MTIGRTNVGTLTCTVEKMDYHFIGEYDHEHERPDIHLTEHLNYFRFLKYHPVRDKRIGIDNLIPLSNQFNSSAVILNIDMFSRGFLMTHEFYNWGDICQRMGSLIICFLFPAIMLLQ